MGFGALISFTRRGETNPLELGYVRAVVSIGLIVVIASLLPVGLSRFGVSDRTLWLTSSCSLLALIWCVIVISLRAAESRDQILAPVRAYPVTAGGFLLVLELSVQVPLVLVIVGAFPGQAPALYTMSLIVNLLEAALMLALVVFHETPTTST